MTLETLMAGYTPSASFAGVATNDNFVLAIDCETPSTTATDVEDYTVVQAGITGVDAGLSADTDEKTYIRQGKTTVKTATQRTFNISGDRMHGDAFQDFALSHAVKFGVGQAVVRDYVFFSLLTGKGEKGEASIIVNSDGSGEAGSTAEVDIDIMATGTPSEYTWVAPVPPGH